MQVTHHFTTYCYLIDNPAGWLALPLVCSQMKPYVAPIQASCIMTAGELQNWRNTARNMLEVGQLIGHINYGSMTCKYQNAGI